MTVTAKCELSGLGLAILAIYYIQDMYSPEAIPGPGPGHARSSLSICQSSRTYEFEAHVHANHVPQL